MVVLCKPHGNHRAKPIVDTQKIKESKHVTTERHQITKQEKKGK